MKFPKIGDGNITYTERQTKPEPDSMSRKSSFHLGDCLCGVFILKIIQLFSSKSLEPWPIWVMALWGIVILTLWAREN